LAWFITALPAAIFIFLFVFGSIHLLFRLSRKDRLDMKIRAGEFQVDNSGPLSVAEWIALVVLLATLAGWLTVPLHGIGETWIALLGLLAFLSTGVLDKKTFKNDVDWALILFFGIVNSMAIVSRHLEVDRWLVEIIEPVLGSATDPFTFLTTVVIIVFCARFFLRKAAAALILPLLMMPYGQQIGIHPGVVLITILAAGECFLLAYQDGPYQIAYSSTNGQAFTHTQARKVLACKFIATLLGVAISVPYWRMLGLIQ
jgi:DASS family divalent anion:Na+ symporter